MATIDDSSTSEESANTRATNSSGSGGDDDDVRRLSIAETLNLLDDSGMIKTWQGMERLFDGTDAAKRPAFVASCAAWQESIKDYVKVELRAAHDRGDMKKGDFIGDPTTLGFPLADMELDPAETPAVFGKLTPQKLAKVHKEERMFDRWPLLPAKTDSEIVSRQWLAAAQRIGHKVLLADPTLLYGRVLMPGLCTNDAVDADDMATAPQPAKDANGLPMFTDLAHVTKKELDTNALIVVPRTALKSLAETYDSTGTGPNGELDIMRIVRVDRVQMTLAQYVATLERELAVVEQDKDEKHRERQQMMSDRINQLLTIAKSYYEGNEPANPDVLGPGRVDPHKLVLDLHMYTKYANEALKNSLPLYTVFNEIKCDKATRDSDDWQKAAARGELNAQKVFDRKNRCEYKLELALRARGADKVAITTHRYVRFTISAPIVNDYVWLTLLNKSAFRAKAMSKTVSAPEETDDADDDNDADDKKKKTASSSSSSSSKKKKTKTTKPAAPTAQDDDDEDEDDIEKAEAGRETGMAVDEPAVTEKQLAAETSVVDTGKKVKSAAELALTNDGTDAMWNAMDKASAAADKPSTLASPAKKAAAKKTSKPAPTATKKAATKQATKRKRDDDAEVDGEKADSVEMETFYEHDHVQNELLDRMTKFEQKQTEKRVAGQLDESKLYGALADYDGGKINKQCDALMRNVFYFCNKAGYPSLFSQLREAEQALVERRAKRARTATAADDNDEEDDAESSGFN